MGLEFFLQICCVWIFGEQCFNVLCTSGSLLDERARFRCEIFVPSVQSFVSFMNFYLLFHFFPLICANIFRYLKCLQFFIYFFFIKFHFIQTTMGSDNIVGISCGSFLRNFSLRSIHCCDRFSSLSVHVHELASRGILQNIPRFNA